MEYRRKCNVCGKIWCFTDKDEKKNMKNTAMAGLNAIGQIGAALGGTIFHSSYFSNQTNSYQNKVVDYYRCPSCNSTNYSILTEEEYLDDISSRNSVSEEKKAEIQRDNLEYFLEEHGQGDFVQDEMKKMSKEELIKACRTVLVKNGNITKEDAEILSDDDVEEKVDEIQRQEIEALMADW